MAGCRGMLVGWLFAVSFVASVSQAKFPPGSDVDGSPFAEVDTNPFEEATTKPQATSEPKRSAKKNRAAPKSANTSAAEEKGKAARRKFTDITIDKEFEPYLRRHPYLMEFSGARVIREESGGSVLLSVASVALSDTTPLGLEKAKRVGRIKAIASVVSEEQGIQVVHLERLAETDVITTVDGKESGTSSSEYLQMTEATVRGITKDMPVIGTWRSRDHEILYVALGTFLDADGQRLPVSAR
jgi:hypothetical protein